MKELLCSYKNGNADIEIYSDGTRIIDYEGKLNLQFPLNVDIRVSTQCSFGLNPKTGKSVCSFCHESATTDGVECDYNRLFETLKPLPKGVELAIGSNNFTEGLYNFLVRCKEAGWFCNVTVNQGHLHRDQERLLSAIKNDYIKGLGISYRRGMKPIPQELLDYKNTVVHVIAGIDEFSEIVELKNQGVKKILVLGEKDFGFNQGKVNLESSTHQVWAWSLRKLFDIFDVVSFDNLAIEQLDVKRFLPKDQWDSFYQGEYSFYINAVGGYFSPSSRSPLKTCWSMGLEKYFSTINKDFFKYKEA